MLITNLRIYTKEVWVYLYLFFSFCQFTLAKFDSVSILQANQTIVSMNIASLPSKYGGVEVTISDIQELQSRSAIFRKIARDGDSGDLIVPFKLKNLIRKHLKLQLLKPAK